MAYVPVDAKLRAVLLYIESVQNANDICANFGISRRTLSRWVKSYRSNGIHGLHSKKPGPACSKYAISDRLEQQILTLKQRHLSWGARRIKYQYNLPCHWITVHRIIKRHGLLVRIKAKPQASKRFQRRYVDSLWQADTFQFRISNVGKVYVTGFTDDRSRYRITSKAYLHKGASEAVNALYHAIKKARLPKQLYLDNGKQFVSNDFRKELVRLHIKPVYGRPYHPRGRGKIESYHKVLYRELISQVRFTSLSHFRRKLRQFDRQYNTWRKSQALGWKTPDSIYNDKRYMSKRVKIRVKDGHEL